MFFKKKNRELDKEIMESLPHSNSSENFIVNIKTEHQNQILSSFNYDNKDTLNSDFCDYLWKNAKMMPPNDDLQINIYSNDNINEQEVIRATKSHYAREYAEEKLKLSRTNFVALTSLLLGILSLALLLIFYSVYNNFYLTTLTEIMAWVFVWEAVDKFFYGRTNIKRNCILIQKIYSAEINVIKNKTNEKKHS